MENSIKLIIALTLSSSIYGQKKIDMFSHTDIEPLNSNKMIAYNSDGQKIFFSQKDLKKYYPVVINYNNSDLLRIQTKPELKYFIKEVEVSEKRFYELINSIDVSSE
ncbi:hypothetical protein LNJ05_12270 [Tenacibaculum finnmarkense genomovar ulcerans]|uniref:hypothetical protein n=1 Tax=Tenacibaculum finnmarkense TaxID=2781243 RepID=UPI001E29A4AB|nr:hypothetical protein [Tenacibaculum finnmarkense]MCD8433537.1 hypothetical protein [Tenacibaculum finnmarkense genomovar ulcerans]